MSNEDVAAGVLFTTFLTVKVNWGTPPARPLVFPTLLRSALLAVSSSWLVSDGFSTLLCCEPFYFLSTTWTAISLAVSFVRSLQAARYLLTASD